MSRNQYNPHEVMSRFIPRNHIGLGNMRTAGYYDKLSEWCMARFEWEGIPESIDVRFIEKQLYYGGLVVLYWDGRYDDWVMAAASPSGPLDLYGNATYYTTYAPPPYVSLQLPKEECVAVWGTNSRRGIADQMLDFAARLGDVTTTLEILTKNLRVTKIITCPEGQKQTYANLLRDWDQGAPVIFGYPELNYDNVISTLDMQIQPAYLEQTRKEWQHLWREALTFMGITSVDETKKERLVADEASSRDGQVIAARNSFNKPRQQAVEEMNRRFGLNVSVKWAFDENVIPDLTYKAETNAAENGKAGLNV